MCFILSKQKIPAGLIFLFFLNAIAATGFSQGFLRTDGKKIVNEKGNNVLLRGVGIGGWMLQEGYMLHIQKEAQQHRIRERLEQLMSPEQTKEFYDEWLKNNTRKIDIDSMKAWGFNSVRLPMHYNLYTLPVEKEPVAGKNTWIDKGFLMTDSLLAWCKANHMYLILDLHAAPGGQGNDLNISDRDSSKPSLWQSDANKQKTIALWKKLAQRYAKEPWIGGYDILNETNWGFEDPVNDKNGLKEQKNQELKQLMTDITKAIREADTRHIVIIEGNGWGNNYNGILPPWDKNMVLSFHKYWNKNTKNEIQRMLDARDKYNVPVWIGETGENSNVWFTEAIRLFEENNIGWSWWPLKKMGISNPLEIRPNHNFMHVANYLNGTGQKPKESDVYSGSIELAVYSRLENCIFHKDVIDAMFRQVHSNATLPFKSNKLADKSILKAVDYDLGRNGYAYFDNDTANYGGPGGNVGNKGHAYRNDGVDIRKDSARFGRYYVTDITDGEWLQYTVRPTKPAIYTLKISVSSDNDKGRISVLVNGKVVAAGLKVPQTNAENEWQTVEVPGIQLKNTDKLRLLFNTGGFELQEIEFVK